jgi:hypothetical protein
MYKVLTAEEERELSRLVLRAKPVHPDGDTFKINLLITLTKGVDGEIGFSSPLDFFKCVIRRVT